MAGPNDTFGLNNTERQEGALDNLDILSLNLTDDEIARIIGNRVEQSEAFWNRELDLDKNRDKNEKYWLNKALDESQLYEFQVPYKEPRIFVAIETLLPMVLAQPPQPLVAEARDSDASRELARNLGNTLLAKYEDLYIKKKLEMVVRHLLAGYRVGILKYRWDDTIGTLQPDGSYSGDIAVDALRPTRVVFDSGANDVDNIPLIAEYQTATIEELCYKFPNKRDEIYQKLGVKTTAANRLSKRVGYLEVWFTYYDKQGKKQEGVAWKLNDIILDSMKNPNFNYKDPKANYFDRPKKPYILFNHLNLGRYILDDTSLTEQAASQQDVLDKRGRQIVENADQANGGTLWNETMISQDNVAKLIGDPREQAMVSGNVNEAATRLPLNLLPPYVLQDKMESRNSIMQIFGANAPISGQQSNAPTLGQEVLSQRSDLSRTQTLATAIEDGCDRLYKGMTQMMKVFYDQSQTIQFSTPEGKTTFIDFSQDSIENGVKVRVKTGSLLPDDPMAKAQQTIKIMPFLDPLSIAEGLNEKNPKEFAKRIIYFKMMPDKYLQEFLQVDPNNNTEPQAVGDIQQLNQGQPAPPQQEPSQAHLAQHQAFLQSPQFKQLPSQVQAAHIAHIKQELAAVRQGLGQPQPQPLLPMPQPQIAAPSQAQPPALPTNNVPPKGLLGKVKAIITGSNQ